MAINYVKAASIALRLLTENGRAVQIVKLTDRVEDENKPWRGSGQILNTTLTVTAVFTDPVSEKDLGSAEISDATTGVKSGQQIAFIAATENLDTVGDPVDLSEFHRIIDKGLVYRIVEMHTLSPGGTPLLYEARVER